MAKNTALTWLVSIASLSLLVAGAVYLVARIYPPGVLAPFQAVNTDLVMHSTIFGSAPSFFYTLALGLVIGVSASNRYSAKFHCLICIGVALCLEISQLPLIAYTLAVWIHQFLSESSWAIVGPFWTFGTFDSLDLLATLTGGITALGLLTYLPREAKDVHG